MACTAQHPRNLTDGESISQQFFDSLHISVKFIYLNEQKIVRPGYTTMQAVISNGLSAERERLGGLLTEFLDESARNALGQLLVCEGTLSELAALKQDAKNFRYHQMTLERQKRNTLKPLYQVVKKILPKLAISRQNLNYYASLGNFYTVYGYDARCSVNDDVVGKYLRHDTMKISDHTAASSTFEVVSLASDLNTANWLTRKFTLTPAIIPAKAATWG